MTQDLLYREVVKMLGKARDDKKACKSSETSRCYFDGYIMALLDVQAQIIIPNEMVQESADNLDESQGEGFEEGPEMELQFLQL